MSYVMSRAIRAAAAGNRGRQAPRPAKRPNAPLSFTEAMDPAKRKEWTRATFGTGTPRAGAAVAVPESTTVGAPRPAAGPTVTVAQPMARIDGDRVLKQTYGYLGYMGVWPSQAAQITATLHAAASHARDPKTGLPVFQYFPRVFYTAPEGGYGKSRLAGQHAALCPDSKRLVEPTKAGLIGLIAKRGTIVVTELELLLGVTGGRNKGLVAVVNAGYEPDNQHTHKQGGTEVEIPLFGPVILDGRDCLLTCTGDQLKTLFSRAIIIHVSKAPEGYRPPRYDREKRAIAAAINGRIGRWMAQEVQDGLADLVPDVPSGLGNRPFALWEPLFAVAEAAGGDWPQFARYACEHVESATGLPGDDEREGARIDSALDSWGADAPAWPEVED